MRSVGRFVALLISLLAVTGLLAGAATAAPPADSAGASPRLKYLPKDYWAVSECDWSTVMKAMNGPGAQANPQRAQLEQYLQLAKKFTGIDPEQDIDWVTLFVTGTADDKLTGLVVIQGTFDNDKVEKRLNASLAASIMEDTYKDHKVYSVAKMAFCFPEDSTILVGDEDLVRQGIDQLGGKPRPVPASLRKVLDRTSASSVVWAAIQPRVLLDRPEMGEWWEGKRDLHRQLKKLECLSLSFDKTDDGVLLKGLGYASGRGEADSLYKYLSNRKNDLLHKEGTNVVFGSLLILSDLKGDGPFLDASLRLTGQAFKELWDTKFIIRPASGTEDSKEPTPSRRDR